jgi:hypothetical protein
MLVGLVAPWVELKVDILFNDDDDDDVYLEYYSGKEFHINYSVTCPT